MNNLYALHDFDKSKRGMFLIKLEDAKKLNEQGYGIHWMPQVFKDGVRKLENLVKINYWIADIDTGDKDKMLRRIACLPVQPTHIVETKRGYHCYWRAKDATLTNYATIEKGISEALCADGSLITPVHTLRFPGFYHMKDPEHPFLVRWIWQKPENQYSESLMLRVFKPAPVIIPQRKIYTNNLQLQEVIKPENWAKYLHTDQIMEGGRNNGLNKIAWRLKEMGGDAGLVLQVLTDINQNLQPPLDYSEIQGIVKGKFK